MNELKEYLLMQLRARVLDDMDAIDTVLTELQCHTGHGGDRTAAGAVRFVREHQVTKPSTWHPAGQGNYDWYDMFALKI
jgi:hypothetical protein